ncbi:MAG: hypothetical protein WA433_13900 [Desulfobaccales bacterium]
MDDFFPQLETYELEKIIKATVESLKSITQERFYRTERGYQGRFYCALQESLDGMGIFDNGVILEMEYQKTASLHQTTQRPDIVLHIPFEYSGAKRNINNYAVWALKHHGNYRKVRDDFTKLDLMFENLHYPIGLTIIIDSDQPMLASYKGNFQERIHSFAVKLNNGAILIKHEYFEVNKLTENRKLKTENRHHALFSD